MLAAYFKDLLLCIVEGVPIAVCLTKVAVALLNIGVVDVDYLSVAAFDKSDDTAGATVVYVGVVNKVCGFRGKGEAVEESSSLGSSAASQP